MLLSSCAACQAPFTKERRGLKCTLCDERCVAEPAYYCDRACQKQHWPEHKAFHAQLAAAEACGVVVLLHADGSLALRTLPSLEAGVAPAQPGGDCAAIAVLPASDPDGVRLAACTAGARLRVYRWRQATFAPMCEAALAEPVRWMAWASAAS